MTVDRNVAAGSWAGSKYDPQERRDPQNRPLVYIRFGQSL